MALSPELAAIADSWDKSTGDGRDNEGTRKLCDAYVAAHPEIYAGLDKITLPVLVNLLADHRNAGREEEQWQIETYLISHYEPQQIGGAYEATVRIVP